MLSPARAAAADILKRIEEVLVQAEERNQPAEIDPHRRQLFELFAMADALGGLADGAVPDLSAESIARELAGRWKLAQEIGAGVLQPSQLPPRQQARLRTLWSFLRIWTEWSYAWSRWPEFHQPESAIQNSPNVP